MIYTTKNPEAQIDRAYVASKLGSERLLSALVRHHPRIVAHLQRKAQGNGNGNCL